MELQLKLKISTVLLHLNMCLIFKPEFFDTTSLSSYIPIKPFVVFINVYSTVLNALEGSVYQYHSVQVKKEVFTKVFS